MLKRMLSLILALLMCLSLAACGNGTNSGNEDAAPESSTQAIDGTTDDGQDLQDETVVQGETVNDAVDDRTAELTAPIMEWWELYNPNGFDTVTAVISNPNDVPIDVTYDLVYYKDGEEVARNESFCNSAILPSHKDIIWANADIPASTDADDIKMENITVSKSYYAPIDGTYEYVGTTDGKAYFDFAFESKPTLATITFLLYSDDNKNGQFDQGEIVVTSIASLTEQTGSVYFETSGYSYTDYEVFFTAY
ncbi:MAG: hypothetical protein KBS74_00905 [Clostridiales bacterium]|nr:hypothetical protein [Candidatus Cacconaster stercorequi]